jgi:hypothetical protein
VFHLRLEPLVSILRSRSKDFAAMYDDRLETEPIVISVLMEILSFIQDLNIYINAMSVEI